jgi:phospholipid/cholesterol/gamma-HCH transport system substrate-binding protein
VVVSEGRADEDRTREEEAEEGSRTRRIAAVALLVAAAVVALLILSSGSEYTVTASFANASQLVKGNEVVIGGVHAGTVKSIELGTHNEAEVTFSVQHDFAPLHRGTVATIREPALSSIAGRQVQLTLPPDSTAGAEIPDGGQMSEQETVSAVDLDQLFNTLDPKTIKDFKHVIQGFAISYDGVSERANAGFHYLNPFLSTSRRVFGELSADQRTFENLIVDTSQLSGALAQRAPDISALVANLDRMMNALGDQKRALAESISKLPGFMRSANTTFVNLRAALDDLDPLVSASKPVATKLGPFLSELRGASADAVPTISDLAKILGRPGAANDLVELTRLQRPLQSAAVGQGSPDCGSNPVSTTQIAKAADGDFDQGAFGESVCALSNSMPQLSMFRAYTPELVGWFDDFGHSGFRDSNGDMGRIEVTLNAFSLSNSGIPNLLAAALSATELGAATTNNLFSRCPGGNERPVGDVEPGDNSVPFTDGGALTDGIPGDCDPSQTAPGP